MFRLCVPKADSTDSSSHAHDTAGRSRSVAPLISGGFGMSISSSTVGAAASAFTPALAANSLIRPAILRSRPVTPPDLTLTYPHLDVKLIE